MGYNATVIVMVDSLDAIAKDPDFGKKLSDAVMKVSNAQEPQDVSALGHCNAATVIESHHADHSSLIAVGGNYGTVLLPYATGYAHHTPEAKLAILKRFAEEMGFVLHKKVKNGT